MQSLFSPHRVAILLPVLGCLSRPSVHQMPEHEETNSEAHYDYHDGHFDYHQEAPARHQRDTNSESQYDDYDYSEGQAESEYSGDSEDEVVEEEVSSFRAQFVSKDNSQTKVKRGRTAILECAVKR